MAMSMYPAIIGSQAPNIAYHHQARRSPQCSAYHSVSAVNVAVTSISQHQTAVAAQRMTTKVEETTKTQQQEGVDADVKKEGANGSQSQRQKRQRNKRSKMRGK